MAAASPIPSIPAAYGDIRTEYDALRSGCAIDRVAPRAMRATADLATVADALHVRAWQRQTRCMLAVLLRDDGRLIGTATVVSTGPRVVLDVSNDFAARSLPDAVEAAGDVARIRLRGPAAAAVLETAGLPGGAVPGEALDADDGVVCRTGAERYTLYTTVGTARQRWDALVAAGAVPVGAIALETVRIEDAEPCLERDFTNPVPPGTAGLPDFGGAPADEVLVAIEHEGLQPLPRAVLAVAGEQVGRVRVAVASIRRAGRPVALATIATTHAAVGTAVEVGRGPTFSAGVVTAAAALPRDAAAPNY